jgi:4-hydroxybenzoate polyprenyltransferase/phosphoserine phosphatase
MGLPRATGNGQDDWRGNPRVNQAISFMSRVEVKTEEPPLYVDLDGTLIKTNTLHEAIIALIRTKPWYVFRMLFWVTRGQAYLWHRLSEQISLNAALLPYRPEVLNYLEGERSKNRKIVLISGAHEAIVESVANYLGLFDDYLGSNESVHLVSHKKLSAIARHDGDKSFSYMGDSSDDICIWKDSFHAIVVGANQSFARKVQNVVESVGHLEVACKPAYKAILRALRPHQWAKNLLLFAAVFLGHKFNDLSLVLNSTLGFVAFSLCGSAVYIINDLVDLEADRLHPKKRTRPFAAGDISAVIGALLSVLLFLTALVVSVNLSLAFTAVLLTYFTLTLLYTFSFKEKLLIDVFLLGLLYTLRVWAGGVCTGIVISNWALAFFMCLFLSLALAKRYSELSDAAAANREGSLYRRGYRISDMQFLMSLGCSSALMSVVVVALYINSPDVTRYYRRPSMLWVVCPIFAYWLSRLWLIAARGDLDEDPVLFAIRDKLSYLVGVIIVGVVLFAI